MSIRRVAALGIALTAGLVWASGCTEPVSNGDELVIAVESAPRSLDPRLGYVDGVAARIHQIVFDSLVRKNERFEMIPHLAESFERSQDGRAYTFKLRQGVKFHDGAELTSEDVKYTYDSVRAEGSTSPARASFDRLGAIETPDPYTVVFRMREPYDLLGDLIAVPVIRNGTAATQAATPVGTGPFKVTGNTEQQISLVAHPDYFLGSPKVQKLRVEVVSDNSTRELKLGSGETDMAINSGFSPDTVAKMKSNPELQVVIANGTNVDLLGVNAANPYLGNATVRQAIAHGLDRDTIINTIYQKQARRADALLPPESWAYNPGIAVYPHDIARAKELLDAAGFPDPDGDGPAPRFEITVTTSNVGLAPSIGQIAQEQLKAIGVAVKLEQFERNTFAEKLNQGSFALYYSRVVGGNQTPDIFAWAYHSKYVDKELDDAAARCKTAKAAAADVDKALEILNRRAYCPSAEVDRLLAEAKAADFETKRQRVLQAYNFVATRGAGNRGRYCDPSLNDLIVKAERATDREEQRASYARILQIASEQLPQIYLWYPSNVVIARTRVGSIQIDPSGAWYFLKDVTLTP